MYDLLMRLPLLGWGLIAATIQVAGLSQLMNTKSMDFVYAIHVVTRLSTTTFLLLVAAAVVFRTRPSGKASGLEPRIAALFGSFMMYAILLFPRHDLSLSGEVIATLLMMVGNAGAVVALYRLGRSFSIMAESRRLVTTGPYRFVRHPLYLAEEIAMIGVFLQFASLWTALLLLAQIAFQLRRMHNEELILAANFPPYTAYCRSTPRLIPGVY
jgi:protein-S-isoprenylcysteine O-methyltransferase Ste14